MELLKLKEVLRLIPMSKVTWYRGIKSGVFPAPVKFGGRASYWRLSDIENLINGNNIPKEG